MIFSENCNYHSSWRVTMAQMLSGLKKQACLSGVRTLIKTRLTDCRSNSHSLSSTPNKDFAIFADQRQSHPWDCHSAKVIDTDCAHICLRLIINKCVPRQHSCCSCRASLTDGLRSGDRRRWRLPSTFSLLLFLLRESDFSLTKISIPKIQRVITTCH